jgi:hypothetical protein
VQASLTATGTNKPGGRIHVGAAGNLTISSGGTIDASGTQTADGGEVSLAAQGTLVVSRPVKAQGVGATRYGGAITIEGESVDVDNTVTASGGAGGGSIDVLSRGGALRIGHGAAGPISLDVTRSSNNPGDGGDLSLRSLGGDITLTAYADLNASGSSGGSGGVVEVEGAGITTASGSSIRSDTPASGEGGQVTVRARGPLSLAGSVTASNDGYVSLYHREASPSLPGVSCPSTDCELVHDPLLPAPCGDGIRRAGVEQCDGGDLGGHTCQTVGGGFSGGTLACSSTCVFDTTGCTS